MPVLVSPLEGGKLILFLLGGFCWFSYFLKSHFNTNCTFGNLQLSIIKLIIKTHTKHNERWDLLANIHASLFLSLGLGLPMIEGLKPLYSHMVRKEKSAMFFNLLWLDQKMVNSHKKTRPLHVPVPYMAKWFVAIHFSSNR